MSVRPAEAATIRATATTPELGYDLRWYDLSESIVPLWWLGTWVQDTGELVYTSVHQGTGHESPADLFAWLSETTPELVAKNLVAVVAASVVRHSTLAS